MPLPRRRSSFLGQPAPVSAAERAGTGSGGVGRMSAGVTASPRGVFVGMAPTGGTSSLGARVSRRALGISSVFLQGLRSSTMPVLPQPGERGHHQPTFESLNGCLLEYRDKVRALEQLNQQLEEQIRHCLDRKASSAGNWSALRQDWEEIYRQVSEAILDNARLMLQTENVQASAEDFKDSSLYKVIDDANLTKMDLEAQIEDMRAELGDLERNYEEDVRVLYNQLAGCQVDEPDAPIETSLDQILGYIRSHWEKAIERNRAETDAYLEFKADSLSSKLSREEEELESLKTECSDAGCKIQSLQAETESMRALNLGSVIGKLEAELGDIRGDIEQQRRDYETLLSNKMRLELEIGTYHGILDGEESRYQPMWSGGPAEAEGKPVPPSSDPSKASQTEGGANPLSHPKT
ncbi:hypothetical protein JZ751_000772 [Albula glossodonta]|uniref:IF rod domain-containing protein n=1 Tax=Albula glossodonta TaxID=121402 RepID=A0A8T2PXD2_9TELE|nr:hypothetical protein JZ751_000772 [Albula glossodonta]